MAFLVVFSKCRHFANGVTLFCDRIKSINRFSYSYNKPALRTQHVNYRYSVKEEVGLRGGWCDLHGQLLARLVVVIELLVDSKMLSCLPLVSFSF